MSKKPLAGGGAFPCSMHSRPAACLTSVSHESWQNNYPYYPYYFVICYTYVTISPHSVDHVHAVCMMHDPTWLPTYLPAYPGLLPCLSAHPPACLPTCLPTRLPARLPTCLPPGAEIMERENYVMEAIGKPAARPSSVQLPDTQSAVDQLSCPLVRISATQMTRTNGEEASLPSIQRRSASRVPTRNTSSRFLARSESATSLASLSETMVFEAVDLAEEVSEGTLHAPSHRLGSLFEAAAGANPLRGSRNF